MSHAILSPSSAHRWMECPGSMSFPENQRASESSSFADEGTLAHLVAADCLRTGKVATIFVGKEYELRLGVVMKPTLEMADYVMDYVNDVWRRSQGGELYVEQQLAMSEVLGQPDQFGTADAVIAQPSERLLIVMDLKYGRGERVSPENNHQLMLYALGAMEQLALVHEFDRVRMVISQVRLGEPLEWECSVEELRKFQDIARGKAQVAMAAWVGSPSMFELRPAEKTCRWCAAKAACPALAKYVQDAVRADFETIQTESVAVPDHREALGLAIAAVPLVEQWCGAVRAAVSAEVAAGREVIGTDGLPMKLVEGRPGNRSWADETAAESALVGQIADKAYTPRKIITPAAAGKLLDKKATKQLWKDVFEPLITRAPGKPQLALGSDTRPPFTGAASASEFSDDICD